MIRLTIPSLDESDFSAVREVLASGYLVQGPQVAEFERRMADHVGTEFAVAVANCTAALHLALLAVDVGPGDRVAVTTYSWPATANVIALCGAEPVFIDIEAGTCNMDPARLEDALKSTRVKAVLPVHAFGGMATMPEIGRIAEAHGVPVIEDAACALDAALSGRQAGAWGLIGCFSFHPRKAITTGEGGILTTNDPKIARRLRQLRNHGLDPDAPAPEFVIAGYNVRLTEFQAALGISQMQKLRRIVDSRRDGAAVYDRLFTGTPITPPAAVPGSRHVYQSYVVQLPEFAAARRSNIIESLRNAGIESTIGTYHMPLTTWFRNRYGYAAGDFPVTDRVAARALSLPLYEGIGEDDQSRVASALLSSCET